MINPKVDVAGQKYQIDLKTISQNLGFNLGFLKTTLSTLFENSTRTQMSGTENLVIHRRRLNMMGLLFQLTIACENTISDIVLDIDNSYAKKGGPSKKELRYFKKSYIPEVAKVRTCLRSIGLMMASVISNSKSKYLTDMLPNIEIPGLKPYKYALSHSMNDYESIAKFLLDPIYSQTAHEMISAIAKNIDEALIFDHVTSSIITAIFKFKNYTLQSLDEKVRLLIGSNDLQIGIDAPKERVNLLAKVLSVFQNKLPQLKDIKHNKLLSEIVWESMFNHGVYTLKLYCLELLKQSINTGQTERYSNNPTIFTKFKEFVQVDKNLDCLKEKFGRYKSVEELYIDTFEDHEVLMRFIDDFTLPELLILTKLSDTDISSMLGKAANAKIGKIKSDGIYWDDLKENDLRLIYAIKRTYLTYTTSGYVLKDGKGQSYALGNGDSTENKKIFNLMKSLFGKGDEQAIPSLTTDEDIRVAIVVQSFLSNIKNKLVELKISKDEMVEFIRSLRMSEEQVSKIIDMMSEDTIQYFANE